jgi:Ni,Fe-hydrogenase I small subunit
MNKYLYKFIFITLTICTAATTNLLHAQTIGSGKLTGKVIDVQNNETIPFASAIVIDRKTKATVKTGQTDMNGALVIARGSFYCKDKLRRLPNAGERFYLYQKCPEHKSGNN